MIPTVNVLGVGVSAVNPSRAVAEVRRWIAEKEYRYVCVSGVHGVMECHRDPVLKAIHNRAGLVLPDGMPLAWWVRGAGHPEADRVCGPEFMPLIFETLRGRRHFFFGSTKKTLNDLIHRVRERYPDAEIVGSISPPFRQVTDQEDAEIVRTINDSGADIVWVGLSTPKQERWMAAHRGRLTAPALIGVGAAFDMQAGHISRAPKFVRRTGFEWAYRLILEPRRLWRRYLVNNPAFILLAVAQITRMMSFPADR
ncbi:MAG: glycosyl transferase, WecB/TagA/CpsF family [Rhodospirillales bacterium]|nr:glycosyl transferase, WecB/TagA/CpsF family [Rhodospirillales bacterium]